MSPTIATSKLGVLVLAPVSVAASTRMSPPGSTAMPVPTSALVPVVEIEIVSFPSPEKPLSNDPSGRCAVMPMSWVLVPPPRVTPTV